MNVEHNPEELKIALNLISNIKDRSLFSRKLNSIDRIIEIYFSFQTHNAEEEKQVIDFLFECLDSFGKEASILFSHIKSTQYRSYIFNRLHQNYSDKFDFNAIKNLLFEENKVSSNQQKNKYLIIGIILLILYIIFLIYENNKIEKEFLKSQNHQV